MAFDYGLAAGLTFKTGARENADAAIRDMQYGESLRQHNEALAMAKAKMLSDDFDMLNSTSQYDTPLVKEAFQKRMQNIANITKQNPNWATDPNAMALIKMEKQGAKSDEPVLRALAYKEAKDQHKTYLAAALKEPNKYNMKDVEEWGRKLSNYDKFGHEDGEEGLIRDGGPKALSYRPPQEIPNMDELYVKVGNSLDPDEYITQKNGRDGEVIGKVSQANLQKNAEAMYARDKKLYDYLYTDNGKDPIQSIINELRPKTKTAYYPGQRNALADQKALMDHEYKLKAGLKRLEEGASMDQAGMAYEPLILNTQKAPIGDEMIAAVFTRNVPFYIPDKNNNMIPMSGFDVKFDGNLLDAGKGQKQAPGSILVPLSKAKEMGYVSDPFGPSGANNYTDFEVRDDFKNFVEIQTPAKNEREPMVKISGTGYVDATQPVYKARFNSEVAKLTAKQKQEQGINVVRGGSYKSATSRNTPSVGQISGGYQYVGGDPASPKSWKKI